MMTTLFEKALAINTPWFITNINFDENLRKLDIYIDFRKGSTFSYQDPDDENNSGTYKAYDSNTKTWRHLNFFQHECYLHCRTPRVKVKSGKVKLISPPWAGLNTGFTLLFEALVLQLASHMPISAVAKVISETDQKIWRLLDEYINKAREFEDYSLTSAIGMDETSKKKNHDYVTLFVDLNKKKVAFVAEGKSNQTVKEFKEDLEVHQGKAENIKDVSCDMSPAFIKGVKENLPAAEITFDKFHILKILNKAVDEVRKGEVSEQDLLMGAKYLFLQNRDNMSVKNRKRLKDIEDIKALNIRTIRALHIRENFQEIYKVKTRETFILMLKKWYFWATHSQLEPIKKAAGTIKKHWAGVLRWRDSLINNGILEGLNSVVQAAKKKARGFRTFKYFRILIYLTVGGLDFSRINPCVKSSQ